MKRLFYSVILLFLVLAACQNDNNNSGNTDAIISQMDTTISHCYIYNEPGFEETLELFVTGNKVTGRGIRIEQSAYRLFNLSIEGTLKDGQIDVSILVVEKHKENLAQTIYETWYFEDNELRVEGRRYLGKQGDLSFTKINCAGTPPNKKDSTLYDYFGGYTEDHAVVMKNGKYGLLRKDGKITIPFKYQDLNIVNEGSIVFYDEILDRKGLLDVNGNVIIPAKFAEIHCFNEGLAAFLTAEGRWGFMDKDKNIVIAPQFVGINIFSEDPYRHPFNEGLANVQTENGWNYINKKGQIVIQGDFVLAKQFVNGKAEVFKDTKRYFIDQSGNCVENCD